MIYILYLFALIIGLIIPSQAAINNQLRAEIGGSTLLAAFFSFATGTIILLIIAVSSGQKFPQLTALTEISWWKFLGGAMGAFFVFGSVFLAPRIGVASMISLIIAGQLFSSLLFDKFGWLGLAIREVTLSKVIGMLLIVIGVLLINFYDHLFKKI